MQCTRTVTMPYIILELLSFVHVYTLNCVRDITLKLQEVSTRTFVNRYVSLSRSALHKNYNYALPNFKVIALCLFLQVELGPEDNSKTTSDINNNLCR